MSKTQIDRLGNRLKKGTISEADLRLLDTYRRSFAEAFEIVIGKIHNELALEPTERSEQNRPHRSLRNSTEKVSASLKFKTLLVVRLIVPDIAQQRDSDSISHEPL